MPPFLREACLRGGHPASQVAEHHPGERLDRAEGCGVFFAFGVF